MLFTIWGQFLDHDLSLSLPSRGNEAESLNIKIPKCDIHFDKKCTGKQQFNFTRSSNTKSAVRTNINIRTAWIDGGQVYGSDKATADSLREFKSGKMKVSEGNLLPKN
jgi:peroxidase